MNKTPILDLENNTEANNSSNLELLQHMELALKRTGLKTRFNTVSEILENDENSAEFIRAVLHDDDFIDLTPKNDLYEFSKDRARHSVITFLIGIVLMDFYDIGKVITNKLLNNKSKEQLTHLWMLTSLYHDWAYGCEKITDSDYNLRSSTTYYLLQDLYSDTQLESINRFSILYPSTMAYDYKEIEEYDRYARNYHKQRNDSYERVDHGILGGVKIFDRLAKRIIKLERITKEDDFKEAKTSCLTIAQHNIFKSNSKENDKAYGLALSKLHSDSDFTISMTTPLLLLLSLVDTIECVKKLGRYENKTYLQKNTILTNILLQLYDNRIIIDYSELIKRIVQKKDKELEQKIKEYMDSVCNLGNWTTFYATKTSDCVIGISMKPEALIDIK